MRWTRCTGRSIVWSAVVGLTAAAVVVSPPRTASAAPCEEAGCASHMRTGAVEGAPCEAMRVYPFGTDGSGGTLICLASFRHFRTNTWSRVAQFEGEHFYGELCSHDQAVAQSPEGIPLRCTDSIWQQYIIGIPAG